jgi:TonB family protein
VGGFLRPEFHQTCAAQSPGAQGTIPLASQVDTGRSAASPPANPGPSPKKNALAHEVAVLATGARPGENAGKRELFTEETTSVLIFENGGVIRLSAAVIPGQLLFLTNQASKREVVAQVTHKRNNRPTSCYVEVEFTESAPGFWGVEVPKSAERPPDPKHMEVTELVQSAEATADDPETPAPTPSAYEVEQLKHEVEALRKQLESLRETQRRAAPTATPSAPVAFTPVRSEIPPAASAHAEPQVVAPSKPASAAKPAVTQAVSPAPSPHAEPQVAAPSKPPSAAKPAIKPEVASPKPSTNGAEPVVAEEDLLPKPALDFSKVAGKPARQHPKEEKIASRRGKQTSRRSFLLSALLLVMIGTAWSMNWLPWLPPMRNLGLGAPSVPARGSYAASAAPSMPAKAPVARLSPGEAKPVTGGPAVASGTVSSDALKNAAAPEASVKSESVAPGPGSKENETISSIAEKSSQVSSTPRGSLLRSSTKSVSASSSASADASGFAPPKLLRSVRPVVPPDALRKFVTGNVTVDATVDANGHVRTAKALSGPETLRKAAVDTVKQYRYQPAQQNGKPVAAHVEVTIQFWFEP